MGKHLLTALATCSIFFGLSTAAAYATPVQDVGSLKVGQARFWDGEHVTGAHSFGPVSPGSAACDIAVPCWDYAFDVAPGGDRLRVALDQTRPCDVFDLELIDPSGATVASGTTDATEHGVATDLRSHGILYGEYDKLGAACGFSEELFVDRPAEGLWTLRVIASRVSDTTFRMRAKLERESKERGPVQNLLPNLRSTPPFEFTFGPTIPDMPEVPTSCREGEIANGAQRCLRFSMGPQNRGEGPMDLRLKSIQGVTEDGLVKQRIFRTDGTWAERDGGHYKYHATHGHYHYTGFGHVELWRLDDSGMTYIRKGPKPGSCTAPFGMNQWHKFRQAPRGSSPHDCAVVSPAGGAAISLEAGWTDIYTQVVEGNYVEFAGEPDGRYVIVVKNDPNDEILESDETDNNAYAVIDVAGGEINVVERGFGDGPLASQGLTDDLYPDHP